MVHALIQARRVLRPDGVLIDLRPLLDGWPVQVSWSGGSSEAGRCTDLPAPREDDAAANEAFSEAVRAGTLQREQEETFPFFYYWDTPKEMHEHLADEWSDVISLEDETFANVSSMWATASADASVRIRMTMLITRYRVRK